MAADGHGHFYVSQMLIRKEPVLSGQRGLEEKRAKDMQKRKGIKRRDLHGC